MPDQSNIRSSYSRNLQSILDELRQPTQNLREMQHRAELCFRALRLISKDKQPVLWAGIQNELAESLVQNPEGSRATNLDLAISHLNQALEVFTQQEYPEQWAAIQTGLASVYHKRIKGERAKNLEKAIKHYNYALDFYTPDANADDWAMTHNNLANVYSNRLLGDHADNLDIAIAHYERALEVFTRDVNSEHWAMTQNNLATAYSDRVHGNRANNLEKAIEHFKQALEIFAEQAYPQQWALIQHNLAITYSERSLGVRAENLEHAIVHFKNAHRVRTRQDLPDQWAATQVDLASAYRERILGKRTENLEQAIELYVEVFDVYRRDEYPEKWGTAHHNLANAFRERIAGERSDNLERAIEHYLYALEVFTQDGYPEDWSMLQDNLATAYSERIRGERTENLEQAIAHYHEALTVRTRMANPRIWAHTQNNLAIAYSERIMGDSMENMEYAMMHYKQAIEVYDRQAYPELWAMIQNNLATAYTNRLLGERAQNLEYAIEHYGLALEVYAPLTNPEQWASVENNLANVYCDRIQGNRSKNVALAIEHYRNALEIRALAQFPAAFQQTQRNLGELYFSEARWSEALSTCREAMHAEHELLASAYTEVGQQAEVMQTAGLYDRATYALLKLGDLDEALVQLEKGKTRLLSRALALNEVDLNLLSPNQQDLLHRLRQNLRELEAEMRLPTDTPARRNDRTLADALEKVRAELNNVIENIRQSQPGFLPEGLALEAILASIPADTVLVAPVITSQGSAIFVVPAGLQTVSMEQVLWLDDFKDVDLQAMLQGTSKKQQWGGWLGAYFDALQQQETLPWQDAIDNTVNLLWEKLIAPIHECLGQLEAQHILLMPQGGLGLLPLHAAWRKVDGKRRYLIDDYAITYVPSMYALRVSHERIRDVQRQGRTLFAVANPTEDLPNTPAEAEQIASAFGEKNATILLGNKAIRQSVTDARAGYLHFACHGFYRWDDPMQSGLILANEESLTLAQIISQLDLHLTRLVVLSACETGITDIRQAPDEYLGLPAGFLQAGTPAVISTLWPVNDLSTMLLMERFYRNHLHDGLDIPAAIQQAQIWLREVTAGELAKRFADEEEALLNTQSCMPLETVSEAFTRFASLESKHRPFAHPYFWAAFTFSGE